MTAAKHAAAAVKRRMHIKKLMFGWGEGGLAAILAAGSLIVAGCAGGGAAKNAGSEASMRPASTGAQSGNAAAALQPFTFTQFHMAMPVEISLWASSRQQAETAGKAAFAKVAHIDRLMNDYVADSEISRLGDRAGFGPQPVSPEMIEVLSQARRIHELTGGAFDPTTAPMVRLWREATKTERLPDASALAEARALVGMEHVKIDAEAQTVELARPGMRLDFGGIAKGYACDLAADQLRAHGITIFSVSAGGDMVLGDAPPGTAGWEIDIPGHEPLLLANTAVSISGDTSRFVIIDGVRYSHVVDPRTGVGVTSRQMAVVIGPRGIETDPLSTAGCVMPREQFEEMIARLDGFRAMVFTAPD